ncbi:MAG: LPS export ABC transporter permease LptG [Nitrospinae bacterium]|nr:LPS export ABC transporter permease LptG [Nitrospinota bacterium]
MKIIDRYILAEFFRIFLLALATLAVFYEMVVFLDMVGYFVKFGATADEIARYMIFKLPMAIFHLTPICILLAALLTSATLSRHAEMTAMKGAGLSTFRIAAPVLIASAAVSGLMFLDSEYLFPLSARETNRIYIEEIKGQARKSLFANEGFWYTGDDGAVWNIGHVDLARRRMSDLSIFRFDETGHRILRRATAREGTMVDGAWVFSGYVERTFGHDGTFTEERWDKKEVPLTLVESEDFNKVALDPEEMNLAQMNEYVNDLKAKGYDATRYQAEMHAKLAFPLISLVMPLIAFPMGIRSSRSGGALVGVGFALVIGALFWFLFSMGVAMGRAGRLPPEFSAYGAHLVFASWGLLMLTGKGR